MKFYFILLIVLLTGTTVSAQWKTFDVGTDSSFRGLSVVNKKIIWASGTGGTVVKTTDGGKNWDVIKVPDAEKLDFRDIEAFDENTAYILSIGNGDSSRIYKTSDGGATWKLQLKNEKQEVFLDSLAFWDEKNGIAQSDPVDGKFVFYRTSDGETWNQLDPENMPPAFEGEAAFAASGTSIIAVGSKRLLLVTGGTSARLVSSNDRGESWKAHETPIASGTPGSGIFGVASPNSKNIVIVGGNYEKPDVATNTTAYSQDGGRTFKRGIGLRGYRSGVAWVNRDTLIAVGTNGSEASKDGGKTWLPLDKDNYNAVQSHGKNAIWAVGPKGLVKRLDKFRSRPFEKR